MGVVGVVTCDFGGSLLTPAGVHRDDISFEPEHGLGFTVAFVFFVLACIGYTRNALRPALGARRLHGILRRRSAGPCGDARRQRDRGAGPYRCHAAVGMDHLTRNPAPSRPAKPTVSHAGAPSARTRTRPCRRHSFTTTRPSQHNIATRAVMLSDAPRTLNKPDRSHNPTGGTARRSHCRPLTTRLG